MYAPRRPTVDTTVAGTAFLDEHGWSAPVAEGLGDFPRSELAWDYGFQQQPRKQPRVVAAAGCSVEEHSVALPQHVPQQQMPAPAGDVRQGTRAAASGAASTSGRAINGDGLLSSLCHQQIVEIDALLTRENKRMRAVLEDVRRRHAMALLATMERAASGRLRAAESEVDRAARRNAELEEKARQMEAECEAWMGVARSHEAVAAGLRATLDDQLLLRSQSPRAASAGGCKEGETAEDARSCCFEVPDAASKAAASSWCRSCGGGDACVLLLPCRHLCICVSCEAAVDTCPVCAADKNASLRVLLS
ncbi:hypothetical protein HU200_052987 [Digitaria exilis]|uniref:RING-type domain-containing protein n=1 Tax=Digitaria exilis TaxID=1010633 RepID=A0A835AKB1_9POAL|nr:hypothetical protein HU200_052987 [Digitaria exilis]